MALTVGELVGVLRADDSGWRAGLASARLRMRGLTVDTEGQLRDLRGRFISEGEAAGRGLADGIRHYSGVAVTVLKKIGPAAASVGAGLPSVAALAAALGGLAAGATAAGLAVVAFKVAVKPQVALMQEAAEAADKLAAAQEDEARKAQLAAKLKSQGSDLATKAEKAYQAARLKTKDAELAFQRQTAGMPKATRDAALAQAQLKAATEEWSASMSGTTMPLYTRGLNLLRSLLPTLTPFVKAAASALGEMLGKVEKGVKGARFKQWTADMAAASGGALKNFITSIGNLAKGFAGLMQAFLPTSTTVTGGMVAMTGAFAKWGTGLKDSEGFGRFLEMARQGGGLVMNLAKALGALLVAAAPLMGALTQVANALATVISNTPTPVLTAIATVLVAAKVASIAYAAGARVAAAANALMASSAWAAIAGWTRMLAVGLVAYARLAAAATVAAARTAAAWMGAALRGMVTFAAQLLRTAAVAVGQFVLMAARAVIWAAVMAAQWLIAMGPIGWVIAAIIGLTVLIIANWDKIKEYSGKVWDWLWTKIKSIGSFILNYILGWKIVSYFLSHWDRIKTGVATKASQLLTWVKGLPGRLVRAIGSLNSLLYDKGRDIVNGLWRGIQAMGGWLRSTLMGWARNLIPGPIAKALGIASPSKVMAREVGRWIPAGIVQGIEAGAPAVDRTMANLVTPARPTTTANVSGSAMNGAYGARRTAPTVIELRSDGTRFGDLLVDVLRQSISHRGGDVQLVLGQRK
ncbi:hypothetical protein ACFY7C_11900 [Streptomyces sp. NPDC012769]|uniref:phage tail protein n=1 Tax=Streptomyces sp. NPDC012769 TaxID=3364848 RepID=UPI003678D2B9